MFWKNFFELCEKNNLKPLQVVKTLGMASGSITKWKNGTIPSGKSLTKIADYFGVSVDYLLGKEKALHPEEQIIQFTPTMIKGNFLEEMDTSLELGKEKIQSSVDGLDEYEKKLIGTFRETTIDGKIRILNIAEEIKQEMEKKNSGTNST